MDNIEIIREEATKLLDSDNSGHGMDHVNRVTCIAEKIAKREKANIELVSSIALLHDVDDYKLFGMECAKKLLNTNNILNKTKFSKKEKDIIINSVKTIGYSKRLEGIIPQTIEAKIVSDADMIDAMGAIGLLRSYQYNISHNNQFFDKDIFPNLNVGAKAYKNQKNGTVVNHLFEKILKLKDLMLTESGKQEAIKKYNFVVDFLREYFYEVEALEWIDFLNKYVGDNNEEQRLIFDKK
ncbi:MAG: HD domain-containing protein [Bacilli bacterium]|nr:HD domain-containing protein [Bacilli bacterium]